MLFGQTFDYFALVLATTLTPFSAASENGISGSTITRRRCKPLPDSPDWPSTTQWSSLNASVGGRLHTPVLPGAVCHPTQPVFNATACSVVAEQWTSNTSFHASNPWSVIYNDDTCPPDATAPCSSRGYPAYAVEALSTLDVQRTVNFARETGVRLVIKGTGHDFLGRSTGPGTLELWTHRLRGVSFVENDPRAVALGGIGSVKIAAGMRWGEVYNETVKHNVTVVGGADVDVGIGGWILHGGHSPISSFYGLGVDQVLEMEVVTADGEYRVIDEAREPDLFWALRGGGASTFAILLSVTVKSYPLLSGTAYLATFNTTANSDTFWSLTAHFTSKMPALSNAGGMGYYFPFPFNGNMTPARSGGIFVSFIFPQKSQKQVEEIMAPFADSLTSASWAKDEVFSHAASTPFSNFIAYWLAHNPPEMGGNNVRVGSWLLGEDGLNMDIGLLEQSLRTVTDLTYGSIGHVVAGKGVRDAKIAGGGNAVLPAWREAYVHYLATRQWPTSNLTQKIAATDDVRNNVVPALRRLQPQSGAYINEADPTSPQWRNDYFGTSYPQLLEIKERWDPEGVFYCRPCVGHEFWNITDGPQNQPEIEWGVGQTGGRLCRKN